MVASELVRKVYRTVIPNYYLDNLGKELNDCSSVLDLGCGSRSPISNFPKTFRAEGVDIHNPSIQISKKKKIHDKYHNFNVLDIDKKFKLKSFDCVIALGLLEHLNKTEGLRLIKNMEGIAKKKIIIHTPNGEVSQGHLEDNPYQAHKSGWTPDELIQLGFKVIGVSGLKFLKGEMTETQPQIKWKPWIFWKLVSDFSALVLKNKPESSFELFCVKYTK